jgi:hypothetical protein
MILGSNSDGRNLSSSSSKTSRPALRPTLPAMKLATWDTLLGLKRSGREADHSSVSNAERKNKWHYFSTPPLSFCGLYTDNCIFTCHKIIS